VVVVAHCHLNANTKVHGLADYRGARRDVLVPLLSAEIGIMQLPCPEAGHLGMARWGMSREQYDTVAYRRHCREIIRPLVDSLIELAADGCAIERVIGVDGSPSCGVARTCVGYEGGEISSLAEGHGMPRCTLVEGRGVFMQELEEMLSEAGLDVPFEGVGEQAG
jgi:predicted secreted protein